MEQELRKKLENFRSSHECDVHTLPTVDHIIQFLNSECNQIEDASLHFPHTEAKPTHVSNSSKQNKSVRLLDARPYSSRSNVFNSVTSGPETSHTSHNCFACNEAGHKIYSC